MLSIVRNVVLSLSVVAVLSFGTSAKADLDQYLKKQEPEYAWSVVNSQKVGGGQIHLLKLTSQVWHEIPWVHNLQIFEPEELKYRDAVLLFITGGAINNEPKPGDAALGLALAKLCGARVAVLPQVPNQPLLGDKSEDRLIAETFVRYLDTKDDTWPLLFPMVKSAVKAMDAVQEWARTTTTPEVKRFIVTGASKRGWTTWLTGASDPRVIAIAPMVIDTLNMKAQMKHALEVWGQPSEQIHDYTERGLTEKFEDPQGKKLWMMVDPFTYRDRLSLPKLIINGANDRYWTLDALNLYWDGLKGPKSVVYLPNAGHNLAVNRHYALNGIGAFFRHHVSNRPWPQMSWEHGDDGDGKLKLTVTSTPEPKGAKLWVARSSDRDFRDDQWNDSPMILAGQVARGEVARPDKGYVALIGDLEYEIDGIRYHLSTQVRESEARKAEK